MHPPEPGRAGGWPRGMAGLSERALRDPHGAPAKVERPAERRPSRRMVAAGGRRLEYEWIGPRPEAAPTLIFLHDGLGCVETWRDFPAALAAAVGCGALVYSRAGYGGSDPAPGPWALDFMHHEALAVLPALLAALGVRDGFLVGHSDGASIALIHAGLAAPPAPVEDGEQAADAASLAGSTVVTAHPAAGRGVPGAAAAAAPPAGWLRGLMLEAPHVFVEPISLESIAKVPAIYGQTGLAQSMERYHGANAADCLASWVEVWLRPAFRAWNIEAVLPGVRCPVLVLQGEDDAYGTMAQIRAVEAGCGGPIEARILARCGHTPHRQQRVATLAAMTAFLRRWL
jgi:pimeloyl-ACP methyl ester carboxylesterase